MTGLNRNDQLYIEKNAMEGTHAFLSHRKRQIKLSSVSQYQGLKRLIPLLGFSVWTSTVLFLGLLSAAVPGLEVNIG